MKSNNFFKSVLGQKFIEASFGAEIAVISSSDYNLKTKGSHAIFEACFGAEITA